MRWILTALMALALPAAAQVSYTAEGHGYYIVTCDGEQVSQHTTEREAIESATNQSMGGALGCEITHDYRVSIEYAAPSGGGTDTGGTDTGDSTGGTDTGGTDTGGTPTTGSGGSVDYPSNASGATLDECVTQLETQGGGWCTVGQPLLNSAASPEGLSYYNNLKGWNDERSIFISWTGWAVDKAGKKVYLLANGGHSDWMGNGVYQFDLVTGKWARLRDPCRLTYTVTADPNDPTTSSNEPYGFMRFNEGTTETDIPDPSCGPASSHTYDGVQFSSKTGTVFWTAGIYGAKGGANFYSGKELWEFNPSETETRNGLEPLTWKMHDVRLAGGSGAWPTSVEYSDGWLGWALASGKGKKFDPADPAGTVTDTADTWIAYGEGSAVYDDTRDAVWIAAQRHGILKVPRGDNGVYAEQATGFGHQPGLAMRNGKLVMWNGSNYVLTFDPDTREYHVLDWTGKKPAGGDNNVYSKWTYLPSEDVFVGGSVGSMPILVYKQPADPGPVALTVDPQTYVDAAEPGSEITIPPGVYKRGIVVNKPLTIHADGVEFTGVRAGKGMVVVNNPGGPVVLDGYTVTQPPGCATNCAGLRIDGTDWDVTLRNATLLHQEMGILTGNDGGTLRIINSEIGETGTQNQGDLSHVVYMGWTDKLVIRDSYIHGAHRLGHLVKSRAAETIIENSRIMGERTRHSRVVEIPCGGSLTITGSVLQQSDRTDNAEFMRIGGGSNLNCSGHEQRPASVTITDTRFITYRDQSGDEPAAGAGKTGWAHWRAINDPILGETLIFSGNTNEMGGDNTTAAIQTLWYSNDTAPYPPPPVSVLEAQ